MKLGIRTPNIKSSIKARTTGRAKRAVKKAVIPGYGKKGMGWVKDPKRAAYNKVYNKTTVGVGDIARAATKPSKKEKTAAIESSHVSPAATHDVATRGPSDEKSSRPGCLRALFGIVFVIAVPGCLFNADYDLLINVMSAIACAVIACALLGPFFKQGQDDKTPDDEELPIEKDEG